MSIPKGITMQRVNSSQIKELGHDPKKQVMYVRFYANRKTGIEAIWSYVKVREDLFKEVLNAESIGSTFTRLIKNDKGINAKQLT